MKGNHSIKTYIKASGLTGVGGDIVANMLIDDAIKTGNLDTTLMNMSVVYLHYNIVNSHHSDKLYSLLDSYGIEEDEIEEYYDMEIDLAEEGLKMEKELSMLFNNKFISEAHEAIMVKQAKDELKKLKEKHKSEE